MKPTNLVLCQSAHRSKQQFESKKKALNFIKFNSDAIIAENGFAPVRSYWCDTCACWHVTSETFCGENWIRPDVRANKIKEKKRLNKLQREEDHMNRKAVENKRKAEKSCRREAIQRNVRELDIMISRYVKEEVEHHNTNTESKNVA